MAGRAGSLAFEWAWSISTRENGSGLLGVLASGCKTAVAKVWIPASFATAKFTAFGNRMLGELDALTSPFCP